MHVSDPVHEPVSPESASPVHEPTSPGSPSQDPETILDKLNASQREAVQCTEGPVLIVAGPGSGKTRTLTHRIAWLVATKRARPYQILALTFTNKAAREMKDRIGHLVGAWSKALWMGTFHATFARLMRREGERVGYTSDFSIYDTDDSERVLRQLMERLQVDSKRYSPRSMWHLISSAKNRMLSPASYAKKASGPVQETAARLYEPYETMLRKSNALDFDDLLIKPIQLFEDHPDVLETWQARWKFIHVDEYQDTNHAQYLLVHMLARSHQNLCVVGDDAQSIYAFRGADIGNILSFQRDFPRAHTIRLEQNYRSTQRILRLASSIIEQNSKQLEKSLWTDNPEGEKVVLLEALSEKDEAQKIERTIRDLRLRMGYEHRHFAVLYRINAQSRSIEEALRRGGIPYRTVGGISFYKRKEIKDVLAYLRLLVNPGDAVSLWRIINDPPRGIGARTQERIRTFARERGITPWEAILLVEEMNLGLQFGRALATFRNMMTRHAESVRQGVPGEEIARALVQEARILGDLTKDQTPEGQMRWQNVQELLDAMAEHAEGDSPGGSLSAFLQEVSLYTDADTMDDTGSQVTLMTIHASKGLEFPVVFIAGMEEGLFPLERATADVSDLEEERRLFYVGATRAGERLHLSHARTRFRYGRHVSSVSSRFLDEITPEVVRTEAGDSFVRQEPRFHVPAKPSRSERDGFSVRTGGWESLRPLPAARKQAPRRIVYEYEEGEGMMAPGCQVEHARFGEGEVVSMEGRGEQARAIVHFRLAGLKKIMLKYANLRVVRH